MISSCNNEVYESGIYPINNVMTCKSGSEEEFPLRSKYLTNNIVYRAIMHIFDDEKFYMGYADTTIISTLWACKIMKMTRRCSHSIRTYWMENTEHKFSPKCNLSVLEKNWRSCRVCWCQTANRCKSINMNFWFRSLVENDSKNIYSHASLLRFTHLCV